MTDVFSWHEGNTPLLVSIPHDGREIPPDIASRMTGPGLAIPDTDWHVKRLYAVAESMGASVIAANYSRYVIDLNRSPRDEVLYPGQVSTGLCPMQTFAGDDIYTDGAGVSADEKQRRVAQYWEPYHARIAARLAEIRTEFGYALLWDAHSIRASVPRLFPGELPDLNIGTNDGASCPDAVERRIAEAAASTSYSSVVNGRFKGGYITRHYGRPDEGVYAVQLELAQRCYMNEATFAYDPEQAERLARAISTLLAACRAGATIGDVDTNMDNDAGTEMDGNMEEWQ